MLEEREGLNLNDPNYVLTRLGAIASGGRVSAKSYLRVDHEGWSRYKLQCKRV